MFGLFGSSNLLKELTFSEKCHPKYKQLLKEKIESTESLMISSTYCPYCTKAKKILDKNDVKYDEINMDKYMKGDVDAISECVWEGEQRGVPYIFLHG